MDEIEEKFPGSYYEYFKYEGYDHIEYRLDDDQQKGDGPEEDAENMDEMEEYYPGSYYANLRDAGYDPYDYGPEDGEWQGHGPRDLRYGIGPGGVVYDYGLRHSYLHAIEQRLLPQTQFLE